MRGGKIADASVASPSGKSATATQKTMGLCLIFFLGKPVSASLCPQPTVLRQSS
jgi:hypothetical protein